MDGAVKRDVNRSTGHQHSHRCNTSTKLRSLVVQSREADRFAGEGRGTRWRRTIHGRTGRERRAALADGDPRDGSDSEDVSHSSAGNTSIVPAVSRQPMPIACGAQVLKSAAITTAVRPVCVTSSPGQPPGTRRSMSTKLTKLGLVFVPRIADRDDQRRTVVFLPAFAIAMEATTIRLFR